MNPNLYALSCSNVDPEEVATAMATLGQYQQQMTKLNGQLASKIHALHGELKDQTELASLLQSRVSSLEKLQGLMEREKHSLVSKVKELQVALLDQKNICGEQTERIKYLEASRQRIKQDLSSHIESFFEKETQNSNSSKKRSMTEEPANFSRSGQARSKLRKFRSPRVPTSRSSKTHKPSHSTFRKKFDKAYQAYKAQNYQGAREGFSQALLEKPTNWKAFLYRGICSQHLGYFTPAIDDLNASLRNAPPEKMHCCHYWMARTYYAGNRPLDAIKHCKEALSKRPNFPEVTALLAKIRENRVIRH